MSAALAAAGVAAAGGLVSNLVSGYSNRETNKTNLQIARETNDANYRLWKENNEYNTPEAQIARYRAAGLNPSMIYGQVSSGNSSSPASAQGAVMKPMQFGDFGAQNAVAAFLQSKMQDSTISLQDSQKLKNDAETNRTNVESLNLQKDGLLKDITYSQKLLDYYQSINKFPFELSGLRIAIAEKRKNIARIDAEIDRLNAQTANIQTQTELIPKEYDLSKFNAATARINALSSKERNESLNNLTTLQTNVLRAKLPYVSEKEKAELSQIIENTNNAIKRNEKLDVETYISQFELEYEKRFGHKPSSSTISALAASFTYAVGNIYDSVVDFFTGGD